MDITLAAMIFVMGIVIFYLYTLNYKTSERNEIEEARYEAGLVASSILSEGNPPDWTALTVTKIGLMSNGQLSDIKITQLYDLAYADYGQTKQLFGARYEYFINLSEKIIIGGEPVPGIGRIPDASAQNTIKITRLTNYHNKPVTVEVSAWKQ